MKTIHGSFLRCSGAKSRAKKMDKLKKIRDYHRMKTAEASAALKVLFDQEMSLNKKIASASISKGAKEKRKDGAIDGLCGVWRALCVF